MLINNWYVLGLSEQVKDEPVGVHALGQDFVLFRDKDGKARCLSDICIHRGGSLCRGKVIDGAVECPYHGWRYDGDGTCVEIPSLGPDAKLPKRARVDSYPTDERFGWIWVFLGDLPEDERPPLPEFFPEHDMEQGEWKFVRGEIEFDCNWVRAIENGVDRTHAIWVHTDFGNPEYRIPQPFEVEDDGVSLYCRSKSKPINKRGAWREVIPDNRDERENAVRIYIPAPSIRIEMYMQPPKSMFVVTGYTPVNEHKTRLIFTHARNFMTDDKHDQDTLDRMFLVLEEDKIILDRLKPQRVPPLLSDELLLDSDRHGVMFRQKVKEREAQGDAIDERAMLGEDEYARVIPSPVRGKDPKNWVLRPVVMRDPADKSDAQ